MKRAALLAATTLALAAGGARPQFDYSDFHRLTASLLKVEAVNGDGSVSLGSGVVVGDGVVATNCHVTRRARAIRLVRGAQRLEVQAQTSDMDHDLCVLHALHAQGLAPVEIDTAPLSLGQAVVAVGFVHGLAPQLAAGKVTALHDHDGAQVIESSTPFGSGASGGALFDGAGRLVGIATFRSRAGQAHFYSVPAHWLVDALARGRADPVRPLQGLPFWQRSPEAQPWFLRAAALEAQEDWEEMAYVAGRWASAEAANAASWLALGTALYHRGELAAAIDAFTRALRLAPALAEAWRRLGEACAASGQTGSAELARERLRSLPDTR